MSWAPGLHVILYTMQSHSRFSFIFTAVLLSTNAYAEATGTADVIGQAGTSYDELSKASVKNRELANQLYRQALADEKAAWSSFPPNVGLLAKALNQSKEGKMADDQAKEFARGAMHSINSGGRSGDFKLNEYGSVPESQLKDLANGSSPYRGAVESKLGSYGMKLAEDKMSIKTPLGTLPINMAMDKLEGGLRKIASSMGYNPDDVSAGLRASEAYRNSIANRLAADLNSHKGQAGSGAAGGAVNAAKLGSLDEGEGKKDPSGAAQGAGGAGEGVFVQDDASRQAELQRNREEFLRKMGQDPESLGPLHGPNDDLFRIVHIKYQSLRGEGVFLETEFSQMMANAMKPASALRSSQPTKLVSRLPAANNGPIKPMSTPK
ncbi:MAG: hypothetical protein AB7H97_21170 [Pseudobdellovibrionaceae bacterium]